MLFSSAALNGDRNQKPYKCMVPDYRIIHVCLSIIFPYFPILLKATLSVVNVAALPDKGERLRTQVKELEKALESLSLTAAAQPGNYLTLLSTI